MAVTAVGQPVSAIKVSATSGSFSSFTPVATSGYVITVSAGTDGGGVAATITGIAWATGGTWTRLAQFQVNAFQPEVSIWYCTAANQGTGVITVTGNTHVTTILACIDEITGEKTPTPTGASATSSAAANTITVTPQSTGGLIFHAADDPNEGFTPTANGTSTVLDFHNLSGQVRYQVVGNANTVASSNYTVGVTNTVTANSQVALEFLPAPAAAAGPLQALPGRTWLHQFKHRQQTLAAAAAVAPQNYTQNLTASLSFTGGFTKATCYHLTAGLSFAGSLAFKTGKLLTAGLSFTGAQTHAVSKLMTAVLSFTGALPRAVAYHLTAALSFTGSLTKRTARTLTAALSFTGSMSATIVIKRTLTAGLSFTGNLSTAVVHFFTQNLTATLSFTGSFTKRPGKALTAAVSFTGAQSRRIGHLATAGLSFAGTQVRAVRYHIASAVSFAGAVTGFNPNAVGPPPYTVTSSTSPAAGVTSTSSSNVAVTSSSSSTVKITST